MAYKLVCFDVDGTLVDNLEFSWQLFHDYFRICPLKRASTREAYFKGEISYREWATSDIGMWIAKGATKQDFHKAIEKANVRLMKGALDVIRELRRKGLKLAIISGSLSVIIEKLLPDYEELFDDVFLTRMYFADGKISEVQITEFDIDGKALALKRIAEREGLKLEECVFVGDHHNDIKVVKEAGLGIAFNCKSDELRKAADVVVESNDLRDIMKHINQ